MKKILLAGISITLLIPLAPLMDWAQYRDRKPFISPIRATGEISIRNDVYGEGHFGAPRRGGRLHKGVDIRAPLRDEVIASKGGRVSVRFQRNGMGKYIIITHSGRYSTLYGHLDECRAKDKERIKQGSVIGYVGKTGNANYATIRPHLHFEIRKDDKHLDPLLLIK
jgi:murein DD-endopeptidase MepM/ murein hydrolase activator NlpD